jgi:hypothetical protein
MTRLLLLSALAASLLLPASASALTVTTAQLKGTALRVEGSNAASGFVTATSSTSLAGGRAFSGKFKIEASGFSAPDCRVIVSDGVGPIVTKTLSGCTPTPVTPPPVNPPPPTGNCLIDPPVAQTFNVGQVSTHFFTTTGCVGGPLQWSLFAGATPPGMGSPFFQGQTAGAISGTPTTEGVYTYTVKVLDGSGATDTETYTDTVLGPLPLSFTPAAGTLPAATRGVHYEVFMTVSGGLPGYTWSVIGTLPPGIVQFNNQIIGTPTTRGTFTFTVRVVDSRGAIATRAYTLVVS